MPTVKIDPATGAPIVVPDTPPVVSDSVDTGVPSDVDSFSVPTVDSPPETVNSDEKSPEVVAAVAPIETAPDEPAVLSAGLGEVSGAPAITKSPTTQQLEEISQVLRDSGADTMSQQKCMNRIREILSR